MTTGLGPYVVTDATDSDDTGVGSPAIETTLTASRQSINVGNGITANAEVFNGTIPGPTFRLSVGDEMVVRLVNDLPYPLGIHWHGLELTNYSDGTEITQNGIPGAPLQVLGNGVPAGGTFLYKFKATRPGLFWYHPHHHNSLNQVFRGMYGMIVVTDPLEANIVAPAAGAVLPAATDTIPIVLSDITVCKGAGSINPTYLANYVDPTTIADPADRPEWLSGRIDQVGPTPIDLCEITPPHSATDDDGAPAAADYLANDVPSLVRSPGRLTEGQTVLTNGVNVGGRLGTPGSPRALDPTAVTRPILSGQGLRLQIVNCAVLRYFRLRLTTEAGAIVNLVRIGGEGGLLDNAILEGGMMGTIDSGFDQGEIVLPPATRADVVASIPPGLPANSVLTLWTRDFQRAGNSNTGVPNTPANRNWAQIPTVPAMHLQVTGDAAAPYTLNAGTALRGPAGMPAVELLGAPDAVLLDPVPFGKDGSAIQDIQTRTAGSPSIDNAVVPAAFMNSTPYTNAPHIAGSTRYAEPGKLLELTVTNASTGRARHPFHLHGFSFQPKQFEQLGVAAFTWPYNEFRDTVDIPPDTTLRFRVRLDDRELVDGVTPGGALGRWMFHCHIFFHGHHGMMSELVVTSADGKEKPNVNVGGSWAYAPVGGTATRQGTFFHRDGLLMTLDASKGTIIPSGPASSGTWSWSYTSAAGDPASSEYVYITATDSDGRKDQAVFRLQIGGMDAGSDVGDPHIRTVDGTRYDFQAAGEFTMLHDRDGMEVQVRQTPVETPPPITDSYSGLTTCVSLNTAAAARVGSHRITYQPFREPDRLQFMVDGEPTQPPKEGIDLDDHHVTAFDAGGETALRIDYAHGPVVTFTPRFWASYGLYYLDISVTNTNATEGLMGRIQPGTWLPNLPSGATVGAMPADLHERYNMLYRTFADAWRVTDHTSMFEYLPWTSTATFTDRDWPYEKPPCTLKSDFQKPENPILKNISVTRAERLCKGVTEKDLHESCVFDVATTGDETFVTGYLVAQELRLNGTAVQVVGDKPLTRPGETLVVTATVLPLAPGRPIPTGTVSFLIDGVGYGQPVVLDKLGRSSMKIERLRDGVHRLRAHYTPRGENGFYQASSSPNLLHPVEREARTRSGAPYEITGQFYEACDCFTVCPCWLGNSPDEGECTGVFAWEIEKGTIDGVDVTGLRAVSVSQHLGPRDEARQRVMIFVDERATRVQADALAAAFSGSLGGPLQELSELLGEMLGVERAPIEIRREGRLTTLTVDRRIQIEGTAREGPAGRMSLSDGALSEVLGSPAEVGESGRFRVGLSAHAIELDLRGRSTMSGRFAYRHVPGPDSLVPVLPGHGHRG